MNAQSWRRGGGERKGLGRAPKVGWAGALGHGGHGGWDSQAEP